MGSEVTDALLDGLKPEHFGAEKPRLLEPGETYEEMDRDELLYLTLYRLHERITAIERRLP